MCHFDIQELYKKIIIPVQIYNESNNYLLSVS